MSLDIRVQRDTGNSRAPDIIEPLLCETAAMLARGRVELDDLGGYFDEVDIEVPYRSGLGVGKLIQVEDHQFAVSWMAVIVSIDHSCSVTENSYSETTRLRVKRKKV